MYCLTRSIGRGRGGSSKILDAMSASAPGGSHVTLDYFWLTMISLSWASHASSVGAAAAPSFGVTKSDGVDHGVQLPDVAVEMPFEDFMRLPHCEKLGAVDNSTLWQLLNAHKCSHTNCNYDISHTSDTGDEQLVYHYYSPASLHRQDACSNMSLPDLQQMPSHV